MKVVKGDLKPYVISEQEIKERMDIKSVEVKSVCPVCDATNYIELLESYLTEYSAQELEAMRKMWNGCMEDMDRTCVAVYGEDPRIAYLRSIMCEVKERLLRPDFSVISGGKKDGD